MGHLPFLLKLQLTTLSEGRRWTMQACMAKTGDGLYEGLDWLSTELKGKTASGSNWNLLNRLNPFFKKTSTDNNTNNSSSSNDNNKDVVKLPTETELKDDVVFLKAFEDTLLVRVRACTRSERC